MVISIDTIPLSMFFTEGICLNFSHKNLQELITSTVIKDKLPESNLSFIKGDTVLLCTHIIKNILIMKI